MNSPAASGHRRWGRERRLVRRRAHVDMMRRVEIVVTPARCAGTDAETGGDNVEPELPPLQLTGNGPAAGRRLPPPASDPGFQTAEPAAVA